MSTSKVDHSPIKFSVIIPTYNRASLIKELLNSFVLQTYKDFEIIICDDGSTDNTSEVVAEFEDKLNILYEVFDNTGGPAYPRNRGIEISRCEWLCFLDSDDLWTNDKLQVLANNIAEGDALLYCHPVSLLDKQNNEIGIIGKYKKSLFLSDFESLLYNGSQVVNSSLCVHKSVLTKDFFYNTDPAYQAIEDYIFILNITSSGVALRSIPNVLGYYRLHDDNISADLSKQISKWKKYFSSRPFPNVNYDKIDSLILYLEASLNKYSKTDKIGIYANLLLSTKSSFEIKKKSLAKLILSIVRP